MSVTAARVVEVVPDDEVSNNGKGKLTESDGVGLTSTSRSFTSTVAFTRT